MHALGIHIRMFGLTGAPDGVARGDASSKASSDRMNYGVCYFSITSANITIRRFHACLPIDYLGDLFYTRTIFERFSLFHQRVQQLSKLFFCVTINKMKEIKRFRKKKNLLSFLNLRGCAMRESQVETEDREMGNVKRWE